MIAPPLDVDAASRVAQCVTLRDVRCVGIDAKLVGEFEYGEGVLSWDLGEWTAALQMDKTEIKVFVPVGVTVFVSAGEEASRHVIARLHVIVGVKYELPEESETVVEDALHFAGINGLMHAWPYVRTEIQLLTTKLGLPPLVLPVILSGHAAAQVSVYKMGESQQAPSRAAIASETSAS